MNEKTSMQERIATQMGRFLKRWPVSDLLLATAFSPSACKAIRLKILLHGQASLLMSPSADSGIPFVPSMPLVLPPATWARATWDGAGKLLGMVVRPAETRLVLAEHTSGGEKIAYCSLPDNASTVHLQAKALAAQLLTSHRQPAPHALQALLMILYERLETGSERGESRAAVLYDLIREHLEEHYAAELTREFVAASFAITPAHLSRLFREQGNETFENCLSRIRLQQSRDLLVRCPTAPIAEIATRCGYADPSYFARVFRKQYGCAPGQYRSR